MSPFTRDWNETTPGGGDDASAGDNEIRNFKIEVSDRLKNMIYGFIAGENSVAQHFQYVQLYQQSSAPSQPAADFGRLWIEGVGVVSELFWRDDVNTAVQLTSGGGINGASVLPASIPAGSFAADAVDNADIAASAVDTGQLATDAVDGTKLADDAVDTEHIADDAIDSQHYANDSIDPGHIGSIFGAWSNKSKNTQYVAATDGFVTVSGNSPSGYAITIQTPTGTTRCEMGGFAGCNPGCCPVRKGDTWKVVASVSATLNVDWLPIG